MPIECDPGALSNASECYKAISPGRRNAVLIYLLNLIEGSGLTLQDLLTGASCWRYLPPHVRTYLLCQAAGHSVSPNSIVICDPAILINASVCYQEISPGDRDAALIYLLYVASGSALTIAELEGASACYNAIDHDLQGAIIDFLLCAIADLTCTPNSVTEAAACFESLSPDAQSQIWLFLGCYWASGVGCTPPDAPFDLGASAGDNEVTLTWPAVPGATSYNIKRGTGGPLVTIDTSAGSPYVDSTAVNGITYFYTVSAVNACGESADSNQDSATPSAPENALVTDWASRVVVNGGAAPSAGTRAALSTFCDTLDSQALTSKMLAVNPFVPDSIIAARTPLIVGAGSDPWANGFPAFVGADITVNGLVGNANKYLDTGFYSTTFPAFDIGVTIYRYTAGAAECETGHYNGTGGISCAGSTGNVEGYLGLTGGGNLSVPAPDPGYCSYNRIANNDYRIFAASSITPHSQVGVNVSVVSDERSGAFQMYAFALNNSGNPAFKSSKTISFLAYHHALTLAQSATFFSAIQALRTSLGGGFV